MLTVSGCPNRSFVRERLREALDRLGASHLSVTELVIDDPIVARAAGMHGSPTVLIDGRDPFTSSDLVGSVSCRLYRTAAGVDGAPTVEGLVDAISRPAAGVEVGR